MYSIILFTYINNFLVCLDWQFDCKFGKPRCVSLYSFMDGKIDCASGFDEACPAHYFVCLDRSNCIDPKKYLDGHQDCRDGSDERKFANAYLHLHLKFSIEFGISCFTFQFMCNNIILHFSMSRSTFSMPRPIQVYTIELFPRQHRRLS